MNEACFPLNGWEVVQRNVGIVWEDSPGLGLTSSTDDEQGGECGFSLLRSNLADSRTASVIASAEPQKEAWLKFGLRSPLARFWHGDTSQELHNQMFFYYYSFFVPSTTATRIAVAAPLHHDICQNIRPSSVNWDN